MDIKVRTNISNVYNDIEIIINAPDNNEQVKQLENILSIEAQKTVKTIIGFRGNDLFVMNVEDIIMFYSEDKYNYCKTKDGAYRIKETLYYLEEKLPKKDFIRISNSAIININNVRCFNTSIVGKLIVKFNDGEEEYVSRRRATNILKFLNER